MSMPEPPILQRMETLINNWEAKADQRAIFLRCYQLMTRNMLSAIERCEFEDSKWVEQLLHRFADYYFIALDDYERDTSTAPAIWQQAFETTRDPDTLALQKLLLGVNAHINYDLVLTLVELLRPEWAGLPESQRVARYHDHCSVNDVIGRTIDEVQDTILEPTMPLMDIIDKILGPVDELMISRLITEWRETVWENAQTLLEAEEPDERERWTQRMEADALRYANMILMKDLF